MEKIGLIGLGVMGAPMCLNLLADGYSVSSVIHRTAPAKELLDAGLDILGSPAEVAAKSDVIILMLPETAHVERVLFGPKGVAENLKAGALVIDMSSISFIETKDFAKRIRESGAAYLDAPVSGGQIGAINRSLTIMVGGASEDFERAKPIFSALGKNITLIGDCGAGQVAKVANQIVVALNIEAVAEALVFASKAGVDPARVRDALMGGFASSRILEVHGERMLKRTFDPGFRISLHQKDLDLALENAKALKLSLPATAMVQELFNSCAANGDGEKDHSTLVTAIERMAAHKLG
ncbi:2-hydroxy-3-oxopropionate reductase [Pelagibacterium lacus]|uniref:2-hydroxy-3-oxopropionate reductase n=1 Tax=Pelagibacterium lacus TaxID=2282655 RepID=A0A369W2W6_9HYPH|nr:2-hydroxy-3-oxopropionate reductase [Pelagibacterium lacus]RDE08703.1 2-hydroxy-3-oxopropionate reductase [Pelagibacterium lacus]